jgi:hypothetical protein
MHFVEAASIPVLRSPSASHPHTKIPEAATSFFRHSEALRARCQTATRWQFIGAMHPPGIKKTISKHYNGSTSAKASRYRKKRINFSHLVQRLQKVNRFNAVRAAGTLPLTKGSRGLSETQPDRNSKRMDYITL